MLLLLLSVLCVCFLAVFFVASLLWHVTEIIPGRAGKSDRLTVADCKGFSLEN